MIRHRARVSNTLAGLFCALALTPIACGSSGSGGGDGSGNGNGNGDGNGNGNTPPPVQCAGGGTDAKGDTLDFANNAVASPAPPGNLDPKNAPQIVVFGWDDIESQAGITFVNQLFGGITNPNASKGSCNVNPNACYAQGWSDPTQYACGDGSMASAKGDVTSPGYAMGNHTVDHLESTSTWSGIPDKYKDPTTKSWKFTDDGFGPGVVMDQDAWKTVLGANDTALKALFGVAKIEGFRAPRLEINDEGLNALKSFGYLYDENLEEILPESYVSAAIAVDTGAKKGFGWIPWPYTLDNGSPGIWSQQVGGDKKYVVNFPSGVWEVPVYQAYVPSKDGTGKAIADAMMAADKDCTFPPDTPADQQTHCYLSEGELKPGDSIKEVTAFDFNTFIYSRMTKDQWLAVMKHTFLLRYYGNRAPLTYGAHPIEYTEPYDSQTLGKQGNNYGYRNVVHYNKYNERQEAMTAFVQWITQDPVFGKDTYFMSAQQLVEYMNAPFDKSGAKVAADKVAGPDSNGAFSRLGWTGKGATIKAVDGNTADIVFNVSSVDADPVSVAAGFTQGALKGVSHIDIKYTTEVPFRVRLLMADGSAGRTALLAGVGGTRLARIRIKDFFPGPEATPDEVAAAGPTDESVLAKVAGISFESAATTVTGAKAFKTHIEQLTLHGVPTGSLCAP